MRLKYKQIRLDNLEALIAEAGSLTELARKAGTNSSYLSQVRNQLPTPKGTPRAMGDELAGKLETAMQKIQGWMDTPHNKEGDMHDEDYRTHHRYELRNLLPLIPWEQASKWLQHFGRPIPTNDKELLPCPVSCSPESFVLRVRGNSMEPRFHEGDLIFVDPKATAHHGQYVLARQAGAHDVCFRQLIVEDGQHYLQALNPNWPERIVRMADTASICGVVVFKGEIL